MAQEERDHSGERIGDRHGPEPISFECDESYVADFFTVPSSRTLS